MLGRSPSQQAWHQSRAQKHGTWKHFHNNPFSICDLSIQKRGYQVWHGCLKDSAQLAQTGLVWILVSLGKYLRAHLEDHEYMIRVQISTVSQGECRSSQRSSTGWMSESTGRWSVGGGRRHPVTMSKVMFKTLSMRRV